MDELNIRGMFKYFWKKKLVFIFAIILSIVLSLIYIYKFQMPKYKTSISISLTQNKLDITANYINREEVMLNQEIIKNYEQMITKNYTLTQVIKKAGLKYTEEELAKMISTEVLDKTTLITISVESQNAKETVLIANTLVAILQEEVKETYGIDNIKVIDPAVEPKYTSNLSSANLVVLYVFVGIALSAFILFTTYYIGYGKR